MLVLFEKLRIIKNNLKTWNHVSFGNVRMVREVKARLDVHGSDEDSK